VFFDPAKAALNIKTKLSVRLLPDPEADECIYSPHPLGATTATLPLDSGVAIEEVQDLLDHKHNTTTQIYDKRRRSVRDSASHKVPI
jgi:site-specific recombinase XerC